MLKVLPVEITQYNDKKKTHGEDFNDKIQGLKSLQEAAQAITALIHLKPI